MTHHLKRIAVIAAVLVGGLAMAGGSSATPVSASAGGDGESAARAVPQRVVDAWARNDAAALAAVFTRDTDFVIGDGTYLKGRAEVRAYVTAGFAGPLKGTRVTAHVFTVRFLKRDVAVLHTRGGILFPGETEVPPERLGDEPSDACAGQSWRRIGDSNP